MNDLIPKVLAELAFRVMVWLIELVGTNAYVNDVVHSLYARCERRGIVSAARSAIKSMPRAIASRFTLDASLLEVAPLGLANAAPTTLFIGLFLALYLQLPKIYALLLPFVARPYGHWPTIVLVAVCLLALRVCWITRHPAAIAIFVLASACAVHTLALWISAALTVAAVTAIVLVFSLVVRRLSLALAESRSAVLSLLIGLLTTMLSLHYLFAYAHGAMLAIHYAPPLAVACVAFLLPIEAALFAATIVQRLDAVYEEAALRRKYNGVGWLKQREAELQMRDRRPYPAHINWTAPSSLDR